MMVEWQSPANPASSAGATRARPRSFAGSPRERSQSQERSLKLLSPRFPMWRLRTTISCLMMRVCRRTTLLQRTPLRVAAEQANRSAPELELGCRGGQQLVEQEQGSRGG